jgi:hypothetical protein
VCRTAEQFVAARLSLKASLDEPPLRDHCNLLHVTTGTPQVLGTLKLISGRGDLAVDEAAETEERSRGQQKMD